MAWRAKTPAVRCGDELDFMKSRAGSTPVSAAVARTELAQLRSRIESLDRHEGRELHEVGTTLPVLYMRRADATLGYRSFKAFLAAEFEGDPRRAYEAMAVASAKGSRWVMRAWTWARMEGHDDLQRAAQAHAGPGRPPRAAARDDGAPAGRGDRPPGPAEARGARRPAAGQGAAQVLRARAR